MGGFGWSKLFLRRVLVVACVSLVLFVGRTVAQDAAFRFEQLSVSKGLSQSWVTSMVQDSYGFVWLGTGDGLNMFNGYSFKVYKHRPEDAFSLPNNYILSLLTDRDGNLWVGSMGGVSRFDRAKDRFVNYAVPGNNGVFSILQYGDFLWLGTGSGIYIFDLKTGAINLDLSNKLSLEITWTQATNLLIDKKDRIWICGMNGLYMFDMRNNNNKSTRFLAGFDVRDGVVDFRGDLWFGTRTNGVFQVDAAGVFTQFIHRDSDPKSLSSGAIISMEMDKNYNIWFGSENGGLNILPRTRILSGKIAFDHYLNVPGDEYSVSSNSIHHILCDKRGDLWLGTYGGGVDFVRGDGRKFKLVHHIPNVTNSLIHNYVNAFLADGKDFWVGTEGGASCFDRDKSVFTNYVHEPQNPFSLSKNAVWCMVKDPKGYIWMSTWAGGVNRLDLKTKRFTHYLANDKPGSVLADEVFSCMIDKDGDFWCTPMGKGICRYDWNTDSFVNYHHDPNDPNSLGSDWTQQIYENSRGEIWIATTSGVSYFNKKTGKFTNFYDQTARNKTVSGNGANVVFEDTRGTMWFGTNSGLNYFVRSTASFSLYSEQDGLPNNTINSILEDGHGNLWLGTNKGLSKFENAIRLPKSPRFRNFDANDGLQDNEFVRRSAYKDTQGYMYFGGINGYNYFHPDSIIENKIVPSVMLTSFNIFNKQIDLERDTTILESHISIAKQIVLPYEKSVFSFEFAALNYVSTPKNNYAYMLEGFDTNWNYIGTRRSVTYTNLKEGHYVFRVKASNNDGLWNESPTSIDLIILPPWWRSIWAYIFYVLFLGSFVSLLLWINQIRVSEKQQIKLERLKSSQEEQLSLQKLQFFTNISHEFRTPLTLIVSPLDDILKHHIKELPTAVREKLKVIYKNTSRMGRLIDELMDFRKLQFDKLRIKPAQHEVGNFVRNIAAHFSEEVVAAQIEFRLNLPEKPLFAYFDANQIEKVIFNLLSNSFKVTNVGGFIELFAFAKVIEEFPFEILCMGVKDSGPGLSPAQVEKIFDRFYQIDGLNKTYYSSTGIGLALAKNLAEMHKGQIKVLSNKGEGASFIVELPMGKAHFTEAELENVPPYSPKTNLHDIETETPNQTNTGTKIKRYTLLVVEDNFQLRKYIKTELQQNYNVMESRDGDEGITRALDKIPDLIISDLLMPEKDGFELCETLKNNPKTAHIPIILLTAKTNVEDQIHGAQIGADLYLTKPFNMSLLKHNVAQLIRNREQLMLKFKEQSILLTDQSAHNAADLDFLQTITRYLLDNITDSELSVESVGDKMNLSRSQLYRKIKTLTGHSANEFIRITRLKQAQKLIKERKLNINEVGYSTGFASPSYFSKCYREYFGNLPSEEI